MKFEELNELRKSLVWLKPGIRREVMKILFNNNDGWVSVMKISEELPHQQKNEISRVLNFFIKLNAVRSKKIGRYKLYQLKDSFIQRCRMLLFTHLSYPLKENI